jgi:dolichol-phosphate mannosyltransferase
MDRRVVRTLRKLPERDRFVRGLRAFVGFRQCGIPYDRSARSAGTSKYTFSKLFELAASGLINFSTAPLRLLAGLTAGSFVVALALLAYALASRPEPPTWLLPILVMSCMGAIQLAGLTIIAEYIRRIFIEVKGRPTYIIRNVQRARRPSRVKHEHKT